MNRYILFLFLLLLISCQKKDSYYSAEITLPHDNTDSLEVVFSYKNDSIVHTIIKKQKKGGFFIQGEDNHFLSAKVLLPDTIPPLILYLRNGFHIQANYTGSNWDVTQEHGNQLLNNLRNETRNSFTEWYKLESKKNTLSQSDSSLSKIQAQIDSLEQSIQNQAIKYMNMDTSAWIQMAIINDYLLSEDWEKEASSAIKRLNEETAELFILPYNEMKKETAPLKVGSALPDFGASTAKDSVVYAFSLRGKHSILFFESENKSENDSIIKILTEIRKDFSPSQLNILTISTNEDFLKWKVEQKGKKRNPWPELYLKEGMFNPILNKLNIRQLPTLYLFDRSNRLVIQTDNPTLIKIEINKFLPKKRL